MTCRHVAQPIPHGVAPQQSPAMLQLRGKDSDLKQTTDIWHQIISLQNDPLNYNSFFPACILTYTPEILHELVQNLEWSHIRRIAAKNLLICNPKIC